MILIPSLSPAWQRTLTFATLTQGAVNRALSLMESASGKGVNVARVASELGAPVMLLTVAGGHRGTLFRGALAREAIPARIIPIRSETRCCQTLIGPGEATEIVEEAPALSPNERRLFLERLSNLLPKARLLILSGTAPRCFKDDLYARLIRAAHAQGVEVLVDTQRALLMRAIRERPEIVKINRHELLEATGTRHVTSGAMALLKAGVRHVIITDGPHSTLLFSGGHTVRLTPPRIKAINAIGSGDAMTAGIAVALHRGDALLTAVRLGVACGTANAMTRAAGVVDRRAIQHLLRQVTQA